VITHKWAWDLVLWLEILLVVGWAWVWVVVLALELAQGWDRAFAILLDMELVVDLSVTELEVALEVVSEDMLAFL
jgi:hypothetical protein